MLDEIKTTGPNMGAIASIVDFIRSKLAKPERHYITGRWTYSGDWINGPYISGDGIAPADVHEQWLRARDAENAE